MTKLCSVGSLRSSKLYDQKRGRRISGSRPSHRAAAAIRLISRRRPGSIRVDRATPPLWPPRRPSATACGFFTRDSLPYPVKHGNNASYRVSGRNSRAKKYPVQGLFRACQTGSRGPAGVASVSPSRTLRLKLTFRAGPATAKTDEEKALAHFTSQAHFSRRAGYSSATLLTSLTVALRLKLTFRAGPATVGISSVRKY
jgi:hypothetical protein